MYEDYAYVLDFLPNGKPAERIYFPVAQVIGEKYFSLLEVSLKRPVVVGERLFIGKGEREKVNKILSKISYEKLTALSQQNLLDVVRKIVKAKEREFVAFFNNARPINMRLHQLETLPGVGKKHLKKILEEREKQPFESFDDILKRTGIDAERLLAEKIVREIKGEDRHYFFVKRRGP